jgi:hypothetical protein
MKWKWTGHKKYDEARLASGRKSPRKLTKHINKNASA